MNWLNELKSFSSEFVRRGGKKNRKNQIILIKNFLTFLDSQEKFKSLYRLGNRHVINFWKANRDLSEKSSYEYWLAMCHLWLWLGKTEKPPVPNNFKFESPVSMDKDGANNDGNESDGIFSDLAEAVKSVMQDQDISLTKLANLTGCDLIELEQFVSGQMILSLAEVLDILDVLSIGFSPSKRRITGVFTEEE